MTLFCALNGPINHLALPKERLLRTQPLTAFGAPFSKDKAIQQVERLIRCRCSKKRLSYPESNPANWVLDPLNETKTAVLRVRTTELMDSLVSDIYQFVVETVPGVTRDRRSPHFAEVEPVDLPFSTRGIPQRCLQPHILPYHRLKRWVTKTGARTIAEAPLLEEEI